MTVQLVIKRVTPDGATKHRYCWAMRSSDGYTHAQSRQESSAGAAKRDAEDLFGPLEWRIEPRESGILQSASVEFNKRISSDRFWTTL